MPREPKLTMKEARAIVSRLFSDDGPTSALAFVLHSQRCAQREDSGDRLVVGLFPEDGEPAYIRLWFGTANLLRAPWTEEPCAGGVYAVLDERGLQPTTRAALERQGAVLEPHEYRPRFPRAIGVALSFGVLAAHWDELLAAHLRHVRQASGEPPGHFGRHHENRVKSVLSQLARENG